MTSSVNSLLSGFPHGVVWPAAGDYPLPDKDARDHALEALRRYISLLKFRRTGRAPGQAETFQIPERDILLEQPDDPRELEFPSVSVLAGPEFPDSTGIGGAQIDEDTRDEFGLGTVLVFLGEHVEELRLEIWASTLPERRAIRAGLREALRPLEDSNTIRFHLPCYFGLVCEFTQLEQTLTDSPDNVRGRFHAQVKLLLRAPEVRLVRYRPFQPRVAVCADPDGG